MADNVVVTPGVGDTIAADEVADGTLGTVKVQYVKIMDGALGGTTKAGVAASGVAVGATQVGTWNVGTVTAVTAISNALPAGNNNIGDVDVASIAAGNNNIGDVDVASIAAGDNNIGNVDVVTLPALVAGTANIGDVDVLTVPADPFGVNADAASATGSISAKLRGLATAWGVTALDLGSGTGGTRTQRVIVDSSQFSALGITTRALSQPVVLADIQSGEYETVAASQTAQVLGPTGATGDYISGLLVVPATTSPGNVLLLDNATSITVFVGGASSVSNLVPFLIPLGMYSVSGAWKVTTGANVSVIGIGNFT